MRDVIVIVVVLGFFALAVGYVGWCERIVVSDAVEPPRADPGGADRPPGRAVPESLEAIDVATSEARR